VGDAYRARVRLEAVLAPGRGGERVSNEGTASTKRARPWRAPIRAMWRCARAHRTAASALPRPAVGVDRVGERDELIKSSLVLASRGTAASEKDALSYGEVHVKEARLEQAQEEGAARPSAPLERHGRGPVGGEVEVAEAELATKVCSLMLCECGVCSRVTEAAKVRRGSRCCCLASVAWRVSPPPRAPRPVHDPPSVLSPFMPCISLPLLLLTVTLPCDRANDRGGSSFIVAAG